MLTFDHGHSRLTCGHVATAPWADAQPLLCFRLWCLMAVVGVWYRDTRWDNCEEARTLQTLLRTVFRESQQEDWFLLADLYVTRRRLQHFEPWRLEQAARHAHRRGTYRFLTSWELQADGSYQWWVRLAPAHLHNRHGR